MDADNPSERAVRPCNLQPRTAIPESLVMPCLLVLIAFFVPRVAIVLLVLFSDYIGRATSTVLWPLLGFFFAPYTTLAYAWAINSSGKLAGFQLVVFVIAILMDLSAHGSAAASRAKRKIAQA